MVDMARYFDPVRAENASTFVFEEAGVLAVRVALTARRPLLLRGPYGSGKTSFGVAIANVLGIRLHSAQLRSTSSMADLVYRFDEARYLRDAQIRASQSADAANYVTLGPIGLAIAQRAPAVVLLENIDLTSESLQLDLIELLGTGRFAVTETGSVYATDAPMVFVLTSEERKKLEPGLLARTIAYVMPAPTLEMLHRIAYVHYPEADRALVDHITEWITKRMSRRELVGPSEFLDVLRVAFDLKLTPGDPAWRAIEAMIPTTDRGPDLSSLPVPSAGDLRPPIAAAPQAAVFLSYAREDHERARYLVDQFTAQGLRVFWDREIQAGSHYRRVIQDALNAAKCVVVLWSAASVDSSWVQDEATIAADRHILIPALLEDVHPPIGLRSLQCVDLRTWTMSPGDDGAVEALVSAVRQLVNAHDWSAPPGVKPPARGPAGDFENCVQRLPEVDARDPFGDRSIPPGLVSWQRNVKVIAESIALLKKRYEQSDSRGRAACRALTTMLSDLGEEEFLAMRAAIHVLKQVPRVIGGPGEPGDAWFVTNLMFDKAPEINGWNWYAIQTGNTFQLARGDVAVRVVDALEGLGRTHFVVTNGGHDRARKGNLMHTVVDLLAEAMPLPERGSGSTAIET